MSLHRVGADYLLSLPIFYHLKWMFSSAFQGYFPIFSASALIFSFFRVF